ncbi:MAG: ATPase [Pelagimonas sp.]|jgi:glucosamine kinase|nr:ATPase [Pelagimonas sp.]
MDTGVIGVDAGGTTCRAALLWQGRCVTFTGPGCNASSDFEGARTAILSVLQGLAAQAGLRLDDLAGWPAYLGVAGVISSEIGAALAQALPLRHARIEEDRRAALVGALGARDGGFAALGTGSFLGVQMSGTARFQGGYGLALGDEASGAWLGREALSATLRVDEGWGSQTALTHALRDGFASVADLLTWASTAAPRDFAGLAPQVVAAAEQGDAVAETLLARGAAYVASGLTALGWQEGQALCLIGGIGPAYRSYLPAEMQRSLRAAQATALEGALQLAQEQR